MVGHFNLTLDAALKNDDNDFRLERNTLATGYI
jgi:hypothetical protein